MIVDKACLNIRKEESIWFYEALLHVVVKLSYPKRLVTTRNSDKQPCQSEQDHPLTPYLSIKLELTVIAHALKVSLGKTVASVRDPRDGV